MKVSVGAISGALYVKLTGLGTLMAGHFALRSVLSFVDLKL